MTTTNDLARRLARLERAATRTRRALGERDMRLSPPDTRRMFQTLLDAGAAQLHTPLGAQLRRMFGIPLQGKCNDD